MPRCCVRGWLPQPVYADMGLGLCAKGSLAAGDGDRKHKPSHTTAHQRQHQGDALLLFWRDHHGAKRRKSTIDAKESETSMPRLGIKKPIEWIAAALAENGHLVRHGAGNRAKSRQTLTRSCTVFRWSDSPTFRTLPPARNSQRISALCAISVISVRRIEQRYTRTV